MFGRLLQRLGGIANFIEICAIWAGSQERDRRDIGSPGRNPAPVRWLSQPQVKVRVADAKFNAIARVVQNDRESQLAATVRALFDAKYGWSDGLIVELTLA